MALRPLLGRIWAQSGKRSDPGREKYLQGWTAEIPTYEVLNFLQYQIDLALLAQTERGAPEWGADVAYYKGALAWDDTDNTVYIAKVANPNRNLKPSANSAQWEPSAIQVTVKGFEEQEKRFNDHVARVDNPHKVTAQLAGTYTRAQIDTKVAAVQKNTDDHKADKNNPHGTTAAQIGAVPITGGAYTGDVTFTTEETKFNPNAGDYAVRADAGFFGLRQGTTRLGIEKSTKRAIIQDGSNVDYLMSESEYVEKRRTIEHEYAVPTPDCWIDALSDIHLKQGFGFTDFIRPESSPYIDKSGRSLTAAAGMPCHESLGLRLMGSRSEYLRADAMLNYAGYQDATIFIEGVWGGGLCWLLWDNSGKADRIEIDSQGTLSVVYVDNGGQTRIFTVGTVLTGAVFRLAVSYNAITTWTYLNGVPGPTQDLAFTPTQAYSDMYFGATTAAPGNWWLRTFKTWNRVLTPEQISTL